MKLSELVEFNWRELLPLIRARRVIPVVGSEVLKIRQGGRDVLFDRVLAERLCDALRIDVGALPPDFGLNEAACRYLRNGGNRLTCCVELNEIVSSLRSECPSTLQKLARITDFNFFVSTTIDPLLAKVIDDVRFGGSETTRVFSYSLQQMEDVEVGFDPARQPAVFHLFGSASPVVDDYVVTEEDTLEFIHSLQGGRKGPRNIFKLLRSYNLLLIGCNFPNWLTRFFLRVLSADRLSVKKRAETIADGRTLSDSNLVIFLRNIEARIFPSGGAESFVDELSQRWQEEKARKRHAGAGAPPSTDGPPDVFLSYASEDREKVLRVKRTLEEAHIKVWYDERFLEPGDEYRSVIKQRIQESKLFIPCISMHTLRAHRRFFRFEWDVAIEDARFRRSDLPYIQPLLLDDIPRNDRAIPPKFRDLHMQISPEGVLPREFVTQVQRVLKSFDQLSPA